MIPQRIIDKYNDKHGKYCLQNDRNKLWVYKYPYRDGCETIVELNDLLFDLKYEFAKTVWGSKATNTESGLYDYERHLQQLAITDDKTKYLEENIK